MLRIPSNQLTPGMMVARPIIDADRRVLLAKGQILTERYICKIQEIGIATVYIEDHLGIEEEAPPVSEATIKQATDTLRKSYERCLKTGRLQLKAIRDQVDDIIEELLHNKRIMIGLADIKNHDEYTYQHSVHVCVLSVIMGISWGYNISQLRDLGMGAMLHDIGKLTVPASILNKSGRLDAEEEMVMRAHTWAGFNIIRNSQQVSLAAAHIALQHHEWVDGNGYPRGLSGDNIMEMAQLTAVADVYDALVSDRSYRPAFTNQEAIEIMEVEKGSHLSPLFVDLLRPLINPYPPGTVVILNTGDVGIIIKENLDTPHKPRIRLLFNQTQQPYLSSGEVDLSQYTTIAIKKVLQHEDAARVVKKFMSYQQPMVGSRPPLRRV